MNFLRERPGLMAVLFAVAMVVSFLFIRSNSNEAKSYYESEAGNPPAVPAVKSAKLDEIRKGKHQDPVRSLALAEEILAASRDAAEKDAARAMLPELIDLVFHKANRDKQPELARKLMQRMIAEFPNDFRTAGVRMAWGRTLSEQFRAASRAGEVETVESIFAEYSAGGFHEPRRGREGEILLGDGQVLEDYARFHLARWKAMPADQRLQPGGTAIAQKAFQIVLERNQEWQLLNQLEQSPAVSSEELLRLIEAFRGKPAATFSVSLGLLRALHSGRSGARELDYQTRQNLIQQNEKRMADAAVALAKRMHESPTNVLTALTADHFLLSALNDLQSAASRTPLLTLRLQLAADGFLADTAALTQYDLQAVAADKLPYEEKTKLSSRLHRMRNEERRISGELRRALFENLLLDTNANFWPKVPPQTLSEIERRVPSNTSVSRLEEARRDALRRLVQERQAAIPVELPSAFQERRVQMLVLDGIYSLSANRESAFRDLRFVMRENTAPAVKAEVQQAVQTAFRDSHKQGKFDALIELAGFYGSEFGAELKRDPFRDEFRNALTSTAGKFKSGEKMKYIFVQALLASAFANEEAGRKAQQETITRAFEAVQGVATDKDFSPIRLPSGIPGHSSVAVNNSTEHHILLVYDGPEKFAVLCSPLRKGSFTVRNGAYRIAVMTPLGSIIPYRAERTLTDEHAPADYRIERQGTPADTTHYTTGAWGDYALLRVSDGLDDASVDPKSGLIKR